MALDNLTPDKYQQIIINMSADRTAIVKGIAGSGKSLTLLKKAKQVSTFTSSYAIIVYTKSLKQFFVGKRIRDASIYTSKKYRSSFYS